jgi:putative transposase
MLKGVKIRLYPNNEQANLINGLLGGYRFVYNSALNFKIEKYQTEKKSTSISDTSFLFHNTLRSDYDWLQQHNTKVIKQGLKDLEVAYKNFFKNGRGFPKYKSRKDEQRCRFPKEAVASDTFKNDKLNLTKNIKGISFACSDRDRRYLLKNKEGIKSVTFIKTKTGKYFASILVDGDLLRTISKPMNQSIGIDLGIKELLTLSDGQTVANPKWIRRNEKHLKRLHKQLSNKVKGSNNREKARLRLAKKHENIRNQKQDFLHNLTTKLINENQVIVLEDLNISGMLRNHKLAKAIQELSLFEFRRQLTYKAEWYGRELVFINRFYPSSKTCSDCGWKNHNLTLANREFECMDCGSVIDRDLNAAINIETEGLRLLNDQLKLAG